MLAPYLARLGISHLYSSPVLQAVSGSTHGYDVVDPTRVREELGGPDGFESLCEALGQSGLGQVIDLVPNHMAIGVQENAWWWDVLENGPSSVFAGYFDVDWDPGGGVRNRVLLPVLPDHYGRVLAAGGLRLGRQDGSFRVCHGDWCAPLSPPSVAIVLTEAALVLTDVNAGRQDGTTQAVSRPGAPAGVGLPSSSGQDGDADDPTTRLASIAEGLARLPPSWVQDTESVRSRHRDKERLSAELEHLLAASQSVAAAVDAALVRIGSDPAMLDQLLDRQNYRLAHWRSAEAELDYRRFFDVDTLIGVRVEDQLVFADSHGLVLEWLAVGKVDGVRIDHVDGLADPTTYLCRLHETAERAWVVVEKILADGERLPERWPVAGTTGYEFAALVTRLLVDPRGEEGLDRTWAEWSDDTRPFAEVAHAAKHEVLSESLGPDLNRITQLLVAVARSQMEWRDYTRAELRRAAEEVLCAMSVYRTYVPPGGPASPVDRARVLDAVSEARRREPAVDPDAWNLLTLVLCADPPFDGQAGSEFRRRFQQLSGAVTAKAVEDTSFYRYLRLVALNEVGADPARFAASATAFHTACGTAQDRHPTGMLNSSTHDTKRSEDMRARLVLLSEVPDRWQAAVSRWRSANGRHWRGAEPHPPVEYLFYQTLAGMLPGRVPDDQARSELVERVLAYLHKAVREAKLRTSWTDPDPAYEAALEGFVRGSMWDEGFMADMCGFVDGSLERQGWVNSLTMVALKMTAPGVPDIYQGCEVWDYSLVDPDNRRPVDFGRLDRMLARVEQLDPSRWWDDGDGGRSGLAKMGLTNRLADLRRRRPDCFLSGTYRPLAVDGPASEHVVAFTRNEEVVVVVPRLVGSLAGVGATDDGPSRDPAAAGRNDMADAVGAALGGVSVSLPDRTFTDVVTGARFDGGAADAAVLLGRFPVAVLENGAPVGERSP